MNKNNERKLIVLASLLILFIFIVGLFIPLRIAAAVPYFMVVLLTLLISEKKYTYAAGIITSILTIVEIYSSPDPLINWSVIIATRVITLIGIWTAVFVVLRQKTIEESGKKDKEKMDALFQYATEGILIINQNGEIVMLNPMIEKLFGYTQNELVGKKIEDLIPDRFRKDHISYRGQYFHTPHPRSMGKGRSLLAKRKDRSEFPVEVSLNYFIIKEGKFAIVFLNDVTESKQLHESLKKETERAQRYLDVAPVIFVVVNRDETVTRINKEGCYLLGYDEEDIIGKNWFENFLPKETIDKAKEFFYEMINGKQELVTFYETPVLRNDGTQRLILWKNSFVYDESGNITSVLSAGEDITEKRKQEKIIQRTTQELEKYSMELETSNKDLEQFAYVVSHDLQEPLRKIQSFGERLKVREADKLSEQGKDYVERMNNAAFRMQNLISDLLAFSRITTKAQPYEKVDLNIILSEVISDLEVAIEKNQAKIEADTLPLIDADPVQMRQLFQNLIANSCKFRKVEIAPNIRIYSKAIDNNRIQLLFEDNGIGFDEKHLDNIFDIFHQIDGQKYEGSGIGLAVCKKIAHRHGGKITAQSQSGKGTTFMVILPIYQPIK